MNSVLRELFGRAVEATKEFHLDYPDSSQRELNDYCAKLLTELVVIEAHDVMIVGGCDDLEGVLKHFGIE